MKRGKRSLLHFHFRKRPSCGQGRARYPDTANTFSTSRYLITSIATCSLMTPITRLPDRSGTYCIKWNGPLDSFSRGRGNLNTICKFIALLLKWKYYFCCILPAKIDEVGNGWWPLAQHWGFCVSFDWLDFDSVSEEESHPFDNTSSPSTL